VDFDGRLAETDRELLPRLRTYRLGHLVVTGRGLWQLPDSKTRSEARDLFQLAGELGLRTVVFLDALGAAPALAEKSPQSVEMAWHRDESHYLRGTERSFLAARNAVPALGCPIEVTSARGKTYRRGKDYQLLVPKPRLGAPAGRAPRSWLRRLAGGTIPDGGRVLLSYNALPPPKEVPGACPRAVEAREAFKQQLGHLEAVGQVRGVGIGGRLPSRMRTDKRTAGTRLKNGRLVADRVKELAAAASIGAPKARCFLWGDLLNPCGGLPLPEDSPAASAEMMSPELRRKLTVVIRLDRSDPRGRERIAESVRFLLSRGYRTAAWCGSDGRAADVWAAEFGKWLKAAGAGKGRKPPARPAGLIFRAQAGRILELEHFAETAWRGSDPGR
jgi:hypothetical protein